MAALILGFSGRILTDEQMERLKGELRMTDLLKAIEREAMEKGLQEGLQQGLRQGRQEEKREVAERLFKRGASVADGVEITGLSEAQAEEIRRNLSQ
ncbi:MAG: transposase [Alicyclobacillaceae bacterium]|nr:transposase [Alicyclobacillaceae bacterium]